MLSWSTKPACNRHLQSVIAYYPSTARTSDCERTRPSRAGPLLEAVGSLHSVGLAVCILATSGALRERHTPSLPTRSYIPLILSPRPPNAMLAIFFFLFFVIFYHIDSNDPPQKIGIRITSRPQCPRNCCGQVPMHPSISPPGRPGSSFQNDNTAWRTITMGAPMWISPRRLTTEIVFAGSTVHVILEIFDTVTAEL